MNRRKSLKFIAAGTTTAPSVVTGCKTEDKKTTDIGKPAFNFDRSPDELKYEKILLAKEKLFTEYEMATITILADIIVPKDDISGSANDAKVPELLEFIVKDMPSHQSPMRGGLRWFDVQCLKQFDKPFKDCSSAQQISEMVTIL